MNRHPSALGAVIAAEAERGLFLGLAVSLLSHDIGYESFIGLDVNETPSEPFPAEEFKVDFLFCDQSLLADLSSNPLPKLARLCRTSISDAESRELLATPGVCGWVLDPFR